MTQEYSEDGVRQERTGWRCQEISKRHRLWGYNCPAVDLDFMVAEYNYGKPVALVEYKEKSARPPVLTHPTYQALTALADGYNDGPLPFMVVRYCTEVWWFDVIPVNDAAKSVFAALNGRKMSEQEFVKSLYWLRKRTLSERDKAVIAQLNNAT